MIKLGKEFYMNSTKVIINNTSEGFTKDVWNGLVQKVSEINNFDKSMQKGLKEHKVIKLISAIPYIAGCDNPERIALRHLSIYFLAASKTGKEVFNHSKLDDSNIYKRLESISHFDGGDENIIQKGMDLLSLVMVEGYYRDIEKDKRNNKYNPLNSGAWNYLEIKNMLINRIQINSHEFNDILELHETINTWWEFP